MYRNDFVGIRSRPWFHLTVLHDMRAFGAILYVETTRLRSMMHYSPTPVIRNLDYPKTVPNVESV